MLKSSQVEESQGKRVVVAMRSAKKKPGRRALLADTRRAGLFVVSACKVVHKRQARKVCSAGGRVGEQKKRPGGPCNSGEQGRQAGRTGLEASSMLRTERPRGLCRKDPNRDLTLSFLGHHRQAGKVRRGEREHETRRNEERRAKKKRGAGGGIFGVVKSRWFVPAEWLMAPAQAGPSAVGDCSIWTGDNTIRCPSTPYDGTTVKSNPLCWTDASGKAGLLSSLSLSFRSDGLRVSSGNTCWGPGGTGDSED